VGFKKHFQLMADYNFRMNEQIYRTSFCLTKNELEKNAGAFFGSVLGTLNHILVGDLLWLERFGTCGHKYVSLKKLRQYPTPKTLNEILYPELSRLYQVRKEVDGIIKQWIKVELENEDFDLDLAYANSKGISSTRNFGELISHFFNHQTHHRGQISTLLSQYGYDSGVTDFLIDIPDSQSEI
jgi:uncharacterized damage-inducible protein DinB